MRNCTHFILFSLSLIISLNPCFADSQNNRPRRMLSFDTALCHLTNSMFCQSLTPSSEQVRTPILFVDNSKEEEGDGSFAYPFNNFVLVEEHSQEGDIIYVLPSDSTKGMDQGITLKDRQWLIGLDTLSSAPTISKAEGNVIHLANDNTIMGFKIIAHSGWGIYGENIHNAALCNNEIFSSDPTPQAGAIYLTNASGIIDIEGNDISSGSSPFFYGIRLDNVGTITAHTKLYGNIIENCETGISVVGSAHTTTYSTISHNMLERCNTESIYIRSSDSAFHSANIFSNRINAFAGYGFQVISTSLQPMQVQLHENQIHDCATGASLSTQSGGQLIADVKNNIFLHNKELGLLAQTSESGFDFFSLDLRNNANTSIYMLSNGNVAATLQVEPTESNLGEVILQGSVNETNP